MEYRVKLNQFSYTTLTEGEIIYLVYKNQNKKFKFIRADKTGKYVNVLSQEDENLWLCSNDISNLKSRFDAPSEYKMTVEKMKEAL